MHQILYYIYFILLSLHEHTAVKYNLYSHTVLVGGTCDLTNSTSTVPTNYSTLLGTCPFKCTRTHKSIPSHTDVFRDSPQLTSCYMGTQQPSVLSRTGCPNHKHSYCSTCTYMPERTAGVSLALYDCHRLFLLYCKEKCSRQQKRQSNKAQTCTCFRIQTMQHGCALHITTLST